MGGVHNYSSATCRFFSTQAVEMHLFLMPLQEALAVRQAVNGFKLDKNHTFAVNLFDEIDRYMRVPDEYEPPENKSFQPTVSPACLVCL